MRLILGCLHAARAGIPCTHRSLVGANIKSKVPAFKGIFTGSSLFLPLSTCFSTKSLSAPSEKLAIGVFLQSSFSSSLWSPILSWPSRYLKQHINCNKAQLLYLFTRTKLYLNPECFSTISLRCFNPGVHGLAATVTPLYLYFSPSSP